MSCGPPLQRLLGQVHNMAADFFETGTEKGRSESHSDFYSSVPVVTSAIFKYPTSDQVSPSLHGRHLHKVMGIRKWTD